MTRTVQDTEMTGDDVSNDAHYAPADEAEGSGNASRGRREDRTPDDMEGDAETDDITRDIEDEKDYRGVRAFMLLVGLAMILGGVALQHNRIRDLTGAKTPEVPPLVETTPLPFQPPAGEAYPWLTGPGAFDPANSLAARIAPPAGYRRVPVASETYAHWLRYVPLAAGDQPVRLYSGETKRNQRAHFAVIDLDIEPDDLLHSADVPIRLRAEYFRGTNQNERIAFEVAPGEMASWAKWANGYRPTFEAGGVAWAQDAPPSAEYTNFRSFLAMVFEHVDTTLLARQMRPVTNPANMRIGDVFVHPGQPGHCVVIVDIAENVKTGGRLFLLAQGFLPAQDVHILINPGSEDLSPWYSLDFGDTLQTPEYTFQADELMCFPS